mmetsp:Transcript_7213/g.18451  ORF Transcript_7213/g.18451 Transcript_7213/m.18451 type:complete len:213 (-) Transcript_7213:1092-1730(-)
MTLMLLRSRLNSRVANLLCSEMMHLVAGSHKSSSSPSACPTAPSSLAIFSASTTSAASVGDPLALYCRICPGLPLPSLSALPQSLASTPESLQRAHTLMMAFMFSESLSTPCTSPPRGSYVCPLTAWRSRSWPPEDAPTATSSTTDIWLDVSVPVLSEQITEVQPSVSTDGSLRTMAFCLAIFRVPRARHVVMTAGSPSGIAATARATAILK